MKNCVLFCFFMGVAFLNIPGVHAATPVKGGSQDWTSAYTDPVDLAKEFIKRTSGFWTPAGYSTTVAVYTIGKSAAKYGGEYILFESPNLTVDLLKGGFYSVGASVAEDFVLDVIETAVRTPPKACRNLSETLIHKGLTNYQEAYKIARKYQTTKNLTRKDALTFLENRWGFQKLSIARTLYNEVREKNYYIDEIVAKKATSELLNIFVEKYQDKLGIDKKLPIVDAAFFIKDLTEILERKQLGLMNYQPYQTFVKNIEVLDRLQIEEKQRFGGEVETITASHETGVAVTGSALVSFSDDFSRDLSRWNIKGGPTQFDARITGSDGQPSPCLLIDDRLNYGCYAISKNVFRYVERMLEVSADIRQGNAAFADQRYAQLAIGKDNRTGDSFCQLLVKSGSEPNQPNSVYCNLQWGDGKEENSGYIRIPNGDGWHNAQIKIEKNGIVVFYLDNKRVYTSSHTVTSAYEGQASVVIGGRKSLYDNVKIEASN